MKKQRKIHNAQAKESVRQEQKFNDIMNRLASEWNQLIDEK